MSVDNVRDAIEKFLSTKTPQVLCIRGAWGTGKTFTWNDVLQGMAEADKVSLTQYAHASLFGLNSIAEVKREIFQSTISIDQVGKPFDARNLTNLYEKGKSGFRWLIEKASFLNKDAISTAIDVLSVLAREQIVFVDDLERKGEDLRSIDVLGYIAQLRDERNCKVVLILNDEELADKEAFESYLEKVVDINLRFAPSPKEIAETALKGTDQISVKIRQRATLLGIDNVRVIRKIYCLVEDLAPMVAAYSPLVLSNAISSITLLAWCHLQPELAPSINYLTEIRGRYAETPQSDEEEQWDALMSEYGFYEFSGFDHALLESIRNGYFNSRTIDAHADQLQNMEAKLKAETEVRETWQEMWRSFTVPQDVILARFYERYIRNAQHIDISSSCALFKLFYECGDEVRGNELLERFISLQSTPRALDVAELMDGGTGLPDKVKDRLSEAAQSLKPTLTSDQVIVALTKMPYDAELLQQASAIPEAEYTRILRAHEGQELADILGILRDYSRVGNPTAHMLAVIGSAGKALREMAKGSHVDEIRAMRLGVVQRLEQIEAESSPALH